MRFVFHVQPEDGHYQAPKHVVVPYVEDTLYSTNKYSYVRRVHTHTHYISYPQLCSSLRLTAQLSQSYRMSCTLVHSNSIYLINQLNPLTQLVLTGYTY